mmetsp:Transcript_12284/g.16406  ORF Transcript_12284/g.16406 Transcript_12284/m.16406 type:complete len:167 (+) Transcript_12284:334-834(+)
MASSMRMLRKTNMSRENPDMVPLYKDWGLTGLSQKDLCKTVSGYEGQLILFEKLIEMGEKPLVIDADDLTSDPQPFLDELCKRAEFPWTGEKMMTWEGEMKDVSPLLAPWFDVANGSTGFIKKNLGTSKDHLAACSPEDREDVRIAIDEVLPFYEKMKKHALSLGE